jgi:hypothetical protein
MDQARVAQVGSDTRNNKPMRIYHQLKKDMLARVLQYKENHPLATPIARATVLFTKVGTLNVAMTNHSGTQVFGRGGYRAGATERRLLVKYPRATVLDMAATARGLEPEHPGIADQFRLGRQASSHQQLLATAQGFVLALAPLEVKQLFTDRAFPADLDAQLTAKIAAVGAAVSRKATGRQNEKLGTASLDALSRDVTATMRELRALMVKHLRDTDPTLLAVWNAAARCYRVPAPATTPAETGATPPDAS